MAVTAESLALIHTEDRQGVRIFPLGADAIRDAFERIRAEQRTLEEMAKSVDEVMKFENPEVYNFSDGVIEYYEDEDDGVAYNVGFCLVYAVVKGKLLGTVVPRFTEGFVEAYTNKKEKREEYRTTAGQADNNRDIFPTEKIILFNFLNLMDPGVRDVLNEELHRFKKPKDKFSDNDFLEGFVDGYFLLSDGLSSTANYADSTSIIN